MAQPNFSVGRMLLLLTAFATLAMSCISAFNDFKYADNATLLKETIAQYEANPAMGWAHLLGGTSPLKPWPKDESGLVNIRYCWPNLDTKAKLGNPKVPSGTLVIQIDETRTVEGYATIEYNPEEWDNRSHRNQIRLGWAQWHADYPPMQHWLAAHEIGHLLSLTHEHQRADREHYPSNARTWSATPRPKLSPAPIRL
ncbi:uncharacterized protein M421DRAFT_7334 [Didymella exigua CBS 183.55]|uniref:Peptidase M10 metallopeptidase domain-containing protein n=1 Tax=Didymella exigua CBS 183.55 TaxID=1150837 RepID=A0A6A5REK0_9PLEO|nr:uncharacterized protein M421DRAFT_7334 [Didymella exigua CBS 183.55]KAF1926112.1 hypothetical protein M421DRAFT_7334 [Didymella exigua CBS 183.55]